MKIYARQVPPEYQESPLMMINDMWEGIIFDGNRHYKSRTTDAYDKVIKYIDDAASEVEEIIKKTGYNAYVTITEAVTAFFPPIHKDKYTTKEVHNWKYILQIYQKCTKQEESNIFCEALTLMTGKSHSYNCIRGSSQSEWQYVYYSTDDYSNKDIEILEMEYFNQGTEWIIHEGDDIPKNADDICGYSQYCYSWDYDGIRKELAKGSGKPVNSEDIILYKFGSYKKVAVYAMA